MIESREGDEMSWQRSDTGTALRMLATTVVICCLCGGAGWLARRGHSGAPGKHRAAGRSPRAT